MRVTRVELKDGYKIHVEFNDGASGVIDFREKLENDHREIIRELLDLKLFKTAHVALNTVCWDNGVDFAPEYLHEKISSALSKV
ncbi:MAG: DUF2442 domain-containing protein [Candidatus Margulisbacteria bacterium]|jgi:hypothetical protein|nr:DUF2442 domain-containing protein [Candidatus Margulisiibacteriota bacterium]